MKPLIETKGLKKYFKTPNGNLHAVDGVNLTIKKGQTLGVVGESGCGKSTLGRTILRLTDSTEGEILYNGQDIGKYNQRKMKDIRKKMQIIFQDPYSSINPRLTVSQIIAEPMIVSRILDKESRKKRIHKLMETVGLEKRLFSTYPHELDGGKRQRIGIARALAVNPEFIVCDEPVSALDVSIQAQILNLLMDLQDDMGLTFMFITHDLSVVKHISDEIAVMYLGKVVEKAPSNELFMNPKHPYTQALLSAIPIPNLSARETKTQVIRGEISSPINPEPGCRFAARCSFVTPTCMGKDIELREYDNNHFVACTLYTDNNSF